MDNRKSFRGRKAAGACNFTLISILRRHYECLDLYLHSPIRLHGLVVKRKDNVSFSVYLLRKCLFTVSIYHFHDNYKFIIQTLVLLDSSRSPFWQDFQDKSIQLFFQWINIFLDVLLPITVPCGLRPVFARSNAGTVGSNLTWGMDVCVRLFCLCCSMCAGRGLATGWSPSKESHRLCEK
jgi:hypothetical protein